MSRRAKICLALVGLMACEPFAIMGQLSRRVPSRHTVSKLVRPPGANFSIVFPARPVSKAEHGEGGVVWHLLSLDRSRTSGRVYSVEYMRRVGDNFWNFHAYGDRLKRMQHATVHKRWEYQLGGYTVYEGIYTQQWGLTPNYYRFMNMGTDEHFYIVWVKAKSLKDLSGATVRGFFSSFKLSVGNASRSGGGKPNNGMQPDRESVWFSSWSGMASGLGARR